MIVHHLEALAQKRVVLASKSPRRRELLALMGLKNFQIKPSPFEENLDPTTFAQPGLYAVETAFHKAVDIAQKPFDDKGTAADLIIAADTIVDLKGDVLEKPKDKENAFEMLSRLSDNGHKVHTGVVLVLPGVADPSKGDAPCIRKFFCTTSVWFDQIGADAIKAYIETGEPMDKAGAYGIQGYGSTFVKRLEGCYFNVMGLPLNLLANELNKLIEEGLLVL